MEEKNSKSGPEIEFHFHGDLVELLPGREGIRRSTVAHRASVKDAVESLGIPHTEVGHLRLDGAATDWKHVLIQPTRLDVYGVDLPDSLHSEPPLQPLPPTPPTFLLDVHLGKLAGYMRLLGIDAEYSPEDPGDSQLADRAAHENRILLTCDRGLLMRSSLQHGALIRSRQPRVQTEEVIRRYGLRDIAQPFTRCMACNGMLDEASPEQIREESPPLVKLRYGLDPRHYKSCTRCGKLFWWGTHSERMAKMLQRWGIPFKRD